MTASSSRNLPSRRRFARTPQAAVPGLSPARVWCRGQGEGGGAPLLQRGAVRRRPKPRIPPSPTRPAAVRMKPVSCCRRGRGLLPTKTPAAGSAVKADPAAAAAAVAAAARRRQGRGGKGGRW